MAMTEQNPFPGMNPFLESGWPDVHTTLNGYIRDALAEMIPMELSVRAEERVAVQTPDDEKVGDYRADVAASESWKQGVPPKWTGDKPSGQESIAAKPTFIAVESPTERWLEIRDLDRKLITVIETLSPANKANPGRREYVRKQQHYLMSDVNLVEIDLLRGGEHTIAIDYDRFPKIEDTQYAISVARAARPAQRELYHFPMTDSIPVIGVPLRGSDADVPLDLQVLVNRCYKTGRYWQLDYSTKLVPSLTKSDGDWVSSMIEGVV